MYSHEITDYLNKRNYQLTPIEFMDVINTSPQVVDVLYKKDEYGERFKIKTNDNYNWDISLLEDKPKKLTLKK